eukprot:COSAG05_NODE_1009_length_6209_cov_4.160393_2_plen_64_part_00
MRETHGLTISRFSKKQASASTGAMGQVHSHPEFPLHFPYSFPAFPLHFCPAREMHGSGTFLYD